MIKYNLLKNKIQKIMVAVTFAQANEPKSALNFLSEKKSKKKRVECRRERRPVLMA
jgi:hypothetical protein